MVVWPSTEAGLKMECLSLVDAFGPLILRCCWPLLRLCFWHERLHKQDNKNQSKNNQAKNNNNLVIPTKTSSDAGGLSGFLTVNCVFSIRLLNSLVVAENTPSDAGRGFPSPHEFFTEHTKKNKKFSLSHCPSCSYHPDCPGAVALKRRVLFVPTRIFPLTEHTKKNKKFSLSHCPSCSYHPDCPGAVALRRRGAFPDCPGAVALRRRELFPVSEVSPCHHGRPVLRYKPARSVSPTSDTDGWQGMASPPRPPNGTGRCPVPDPTPARAGTSPCTPSHEAQRGRKVEAFIRPFDARRVGFHSPASRGIGNGFVRFRSVPDARPRQE